MVEYYHLEYKDHYVIYEKTYFDANNIVIFENSDDYSTKVIPEISFKYLFEHVSTINPFA